MGMEEHFKIRNWIRTWRTFFGGAHSCYATLFLLAINCNFIISLIIFIQWHESMTLIALKGSEFSKLISSNIYLLFCAFEFWSNLYLLFSNYCLFFCSYDLIGLCSKKKFWFEQPKLTCEGKKKTSHVRVRRTQRPKQWAKSNPAEILIIKDQVNSSLL